MSFKCCLQKMMLMMGLLLTSTSLKAEISGDAKSDAFALYEKVRESVEKIISSQMDSEMVLKSGVSNILSEMKALMKYSKDKEDPKIMQALEDKLGELIVVVSGMQIDPSTLNESFSKEDFKQVDSFFEDLEKMKNSTSTVKLKAKK